MERFVEKIINVLEKKAAIKNVFTVKKDRYNEKFIYAVDRQGRNKEDYINDIYNYFNYFEEHFPADYKISSEYIDFHQLIETKSLLDFEDASLYEVAYCKLLTLLYVTQGCIETDFSTTLSIASCEKQMTAYFRGQTDYEYKLLPSLYRGLLFNGVIDYNKLSELYLGTPFFEKYRRHIENIFDINYSFISFVQHAVEYSPLLDFSEDKNIALVFATASNGKNYNAYQQTDAALFTFFARESISQNEDIDAIIKKHNVQYYSNRLSATSTVFGKPLLCCDVSDFDVELFSFSSPTNDRMKYQKGVFLYFQKCVIVNGELFFPYAFGYMAKRRIPCNKTVTKEKMNASLSKEAIYNWIVSGNPSLELNHLLNPYLTFGEYTR